MNEQEAVEKLAALLNEIEAAGYQILVGDRELWVGGRELLEPQWSDAVWGVRKP